MNRPLLRHPSASPPGTVSPTIRCFHKYPVERPKPRRPKAYSHPCYQCHHPCSTTDAQRSTHAVHRRPSISSPARDILSQAHPHLPRNLRITSQPPATHQRALALPMLPMHLLGPLANYRLPTRKRGTCSRFTKPLRTSHQMPLHHTQHSSKRARTEVVQTTTHGPFSFSNYCILTDAIHTPRMHPK